MTLREKLNLNEDGTIKKPAPVPYSLQNVLNGTYEHPEPPRVWIPDENGKIQICTGHPATQQHL
jgi:hypothetical protein